MTYSQKIDWRHLVFAILITGFGAALIANRTPLQPGLSQLYGWVLLALGVLAIWEAVATRYEFTRTELVIHSGGTRQRIRYDTIEAVRVARGMLSWFAAPNTVRILVGSRNSCGVVALRPKDRERFLNELTRAVPWVGVSE